MAVRLKCAECGTEVTSLIGGVGHLVDNCYVDTVMEGKRPTFFVICESCMQAQVDIESGEETPGE